MPRCVLVVVTVGQRTADNQEQDLRSLMQDPDPTHVTHILDPTENAQQKPTAETRIPVSSPKTLIQRLRIISAHRNTQFTMGHTLSFEFAVLAYSPGHLELPTLVDR